MLQDLEFKKIIKKKSHKFDSVPLHPFNIYILTVQGMENYRCCD